MQRFDRIAETGELAFKAKHDMADRIKCLTQGSAFLSNSNEKPPCTGLGQRFCRPVNTLPVTISLDHGRRFANCHCVQHPPVGRQRIQINC